MKSKIINILVLTAVLSFFSSCEDFFEIPRPQETQWTTTATYEQGLNTCYLSIQWRDMGRGVIQYWDDCVAGTLRKNTLGTSGSNGDEWYYRKFDDVIGQLPGLWQWSYRVITMANLAIDLDINGNGNAFNLDVTGVDYRYNYLRQVAENYFVRAYSYYILMKVYAAPYVHNGDNSVVTIPFKTTAAYSKDDILNEKRGTREEIYQQIIKDLQFAKDNLPDKFTLNSWNNVPGYEAGRANKWVACAMLGKVYFLMGRYSDAMREFNDLINYAESTGTYSLAEAPKEAFNKARAQDFPKESIWEFNGGNLQGAYEQRNNYWYNGMCIGYRFRDSQGDELLNTAEANKGVNKSTWNALSIAYSALKDMGWMVDPMNGDYTVTREALADMRWVQLYPILKPMPEGTPNNTITKGSPGYLEYESFPGHAHLTTPHVYIDKYFRGEEPYGRHSKFPLIKLADIYLLRGWLNWKNGSSQAAANDLNKVWNRSNPSNPDKHTAANVTHASIWAEYMREMIGEGWTADFIKGTQMNAPRGDEPALIPPLNPPYSEWKKPIPTTETGLNPNYQYD